jgi:hypothetical protein
LDIDTPLDWEIGEKIANSKLQDEHLV